MDHNIILLIALIALLLGNLPKYRPVSFLAIAALVYDFTLHFSISDITGIFHFSIDLLIISVLSAVVQHINKDVFKILFIPVAVGLLFTLHPINKVPVSKSYLTIENKIYKDMEILVQFKNSTDIPNWINKNSNKFDITYPLFNPKDRSGLLDEYLGINRSKCQNDNKSA